MKITGWKAPAKRVRVANADLARACSRCARRFPRMYRDPAGRHGAVVCREGECRPARGAVR